MGLGSKAGGPNYLMLFGQWEDVPGAAAPKNAISSPAAGLLTAVRDKDLLGEEDLAWVRAAAADDARWWAQEFSTAQDRTGLDSEANIFRYRSQEVLLRVSGDAPVREVVRTLAAATVAGAPVSISYAPSVTDETRKALSTLAAELGLTLAREADANFAAQLAAGTYDAGVGARVRVIGTLPAEVREKLASRPEVALLDDAVTSSGRVELRYWVKEQSVSMTLHRFGNPSRRFHDLAEALKK